MTTTAASSADSSRAQKAWLGIMALGTALPLLLVNRPPMSDLPEQVAVIATLQHWGDPAFSAPYTFDFGQSQYVLYHLVAAGLAMPLGDAELANRILLAACGACFPLSLFALLRALGRDTRLAPFACIPFFSRPLLMGFAPYVASIPAAVFALALAVTHARAPKLRSAMGLSACAVLLFYLHVDAFLLFAAGLVVTRAIYAHAEQPGSRAVLLGVARSVALLVPGGIAAGYWALRGSLHQSLESRPVRFSSLTSLLHEFPSWSHDIWTSHEDEACAVVMWVAFAALLVLGRRPRNDASTRAAYALFLCAVGAYVALPYSVGVGVMLNVRVAVFVTLFSPLLLEPHQGLLGRLARTVVALAGLGMAASFTLHARSVRDEELGDIERVFSHVAPGSRVLTLPFHLTSRHTHWAPWTFVGSYARAEKGGVSQFSFSALDHWPLHYKPGFEPPRKPLFWTFDACGYRNAYDGPYYDYVLARGNIDPFRDAPPGPRFVKVDATRDFVLYARVPGEENAAWSVADQGPCESRRSLEAQKQEN